MKKFSTLGLGLFVELTTFVSNAMAADPEWFTTVVTQQSIIEEFIGIVIVSSVAIFLAPFAWFQVKKVICRDSLGFAELDHTLDTYFDDFDDYLSFQNNQDKTYEKMLLSKKNSSEHGEYELDCYGQNIDEWQSCKQR